MIGCSTLAPPALVLPFWAGPDVRSSRAVVSIVEHHACSGAIAFAKVTQISSFDDSHRLEPELVVEFDESGAVVGRWPAPAEPLVVAIRDDEIWIRNPELASINTTPLSPLLGIRHDGSFRELSGPIASDRKPLECPSLPEFGNTAYLRCWLYVDLESEKSRRLAYQVPCT